MDDHQHAGNEPSNHDRTRSRSTSVWLSVLAVAVLGATTAVVLTLEACAENPPAVTAPAVTAPATSASGSAMPVSSTPPVPSPPPSLPPPPT